MKKIILILMLLVLGGCVAANNNGAISWYEKEKLNAISKDEIIGVVVSISRESGSYSEVINDQEDILKITELLNEVSIIKPSDMAYDDYGLTILIDIGDETLMFKFEKDILVLDNGRYEVTNINALEDYVLKLIES